jgi:SNF2-related domain/Helicase conserved C-terminal domain
MQALVHAVPEGSSSLVEARAVLVEVSRGRFGDVPSELVVDHVLRCTGGADFAVREAAIEALQRRWGFARRDGLVVATKPETSSLGAYTTARSTDLPTPGRKRSKKQAPSEARPYTTVLSRLEPLGASCDCPDFLRGSLGVCKHVLVVLQHVFESARRLESARKEGARAASTPLLRPVLDWDPELALEGELDRLTGLRLEVPRSSDGRALTLGAGNPTAEEHWARVKRAFPSRTMIESVRRDPERRRNVLASLQALVAPLEAGARTKGASSAPLLDASPAARALVAEELERTERALGFVEAVPRALTALRTLKRRLYPYQKEGVERFLSAGRLLLADDMGLGKTTQAIASCHALYESGRVVRGVVIVPASLKAQWLREWAETTAVPAFVVDGTPEERVRQYRGLSAGFLILNYEQLLRDAEHIQALRPDIVVLDEAQRIKNYATKSAVYVKSLSPPYRLVLTGTPMENRLEELASILDWVDDVALSPKWRLVPWYTLNEGDGAGGKTGARNLDTLRTRLAPCAVRRVRKEVLAQLPPRTDTRVPVEMTPQQLVEHDELVAPIARLVQTSKRRPLAQAEFLKLMQLLTQQRIIANGLGQLRFEELWPTYSRARPDPTLLEGLFAPKLAELRRLLADLVVAQGRKVVVFSQWRRMLRLAEWSVRDVLGDNGFSTVFFTGAEKQSQRTKSVVDFHDDPRVAVMFLSDAGGVGLNLQKAASACINLELPWNPAVLEQRIGRIYRLGQKRPIDVYNLVAERSIEGRIAGLLGAKQALFSGLFDGTSDEVRFDTAASFMSRIERMVEPESSAGALSSRGEGAERDELEVADPDAASAHAEMAGSAAEVARSDAALADELPAAPVVSPAVDAEAAAISQRLPSVLEDDRAPRDPVASLFDVVRVERTSSGGVRIEAPPEAASSLLALFEGMAKLLAGASSR